MNRHEALAEFLRNQGLDPSPEDVDRMLAQYDEMKFREPVPDDFATAFGAACTVCGGIRLAGRYLHALVCDEKHDRGEHCDGGGS